MKPGDLVEVNETRGTGYYKRITALGVGVIVDICKTDDMNIGSVGPVNLGSNVTVLLDTGKAQVFNERSVKVLSNLHEE